MHISKQLTIHFYLNYVSGFFKYRFFFLMDSKGGGMKGACDREESQK